MVKVVNPKRIHWVKFPALAPSRSGKTGSYNVFKNTSREWNSVDNGIRTWCTEHNKLLCTSREGRALAHFIMQVMSRMDISLVPRHGGGGERAPGTHCLRMCLITTEFRGDRVRIRTYTGDVINSPR